MWIFQSREDTRIQELIKLYNYCIDAGQSEIDSKINVAANTLGPATGSYRSRFVGLDQQKQIEKIQEYFSYNILNTPTETIIKIAVSWEFAHKHKAVTAKTLANKSTDLDNLELKVQKNLEKHPLSPKK